MIIIYRVSPTSRLEAVNIKKMSCMEIYQSNDGLYHIEVYHGDDECAEIGHFETLEQAETALANLATRFANHDAIVTSEKPIIVEAPTNRPDHPEVAP